MNNLAIAVLDGNLVRDPETKKLKGDKTVTTFSVALNHEWGGKDGQKTVSYVPVETWDRLAENCASFLKKGSRVTISGNLRQDRWQDDDGKKHGRIKVVAHNVRFDSTKKKEEETNGAEE